MTKAYVVCEKAYEYNDEYYYTGESDGVTPQHVYTDKTFAQSTCEMLNAKAFGGLCIGEYDECLYRNEDVFTEFDPTGELVDDFGNVVTKRLDELKKVAKFFGDKYHIQFYTVREVDID